MLNDSVAARLERRATAYAELPVFRALNADRVPVERFPEFFREQAVAARFFQDLIWAATETDANSPPAFREFATHHRKVDSGHWRWSEHDLVESGQRPLGIDDCFSLQFLETRIQMARMLALFHDAPAPERLVALAALETAGTITLGTLFAYAQRHGLDRLLYIGPPHVNIEERQVDQLKELLGPTLEGHDPRLLAVVDTMFDALGCMFVRGATRHWADLLS